MKVWPLPMYLMNQSSFSSPTTPVVCSRHFQPAMDLCDTCSSFDLCRVFDSHEVSLPTVRDFEQKLFWHEHLESWCFRHSEGMSPIKVAAAAGCGLCSLLFDAFEQKNAIAVQEFCDLPIILAPGKIIKEGRNEPPGFSPYLEPKLYSYFDRPG